MPRLGRVAHKPEVEMQNATLVTGHHCTLMISGAKERGRELAGYNYPELILDWHIHMAREWPQDKAKKKKEGGDLRLFQ